MKTILDTDTLTDDEGSVFATGNTMSVDAMMEAKENGVMHAASIYARHLLDDLPECSDREAWILLTAFLENLLDVIWAPQPREHAHD